jgi:hypothetical protein
MPDKELHALIGSWFLWSLMEVGNMDTDQILREEQRETIRELSDILRISQEMGRRLANETHGELYDDVRALVMLLHETRGQAAAIAQKLHVYDIDEPVARRA